MKSSSYRPEYDAIAHRLCKYLGATDKELGKAFGVSDRTVRTWRETFDSFRQACEAGKLQADTNVAQRLYERAIGYSHKSHKIFYNAKTNAIVKVDIVEKFPPDVLAMIYWLKNRQPELWRDRVVEGKPDAADTAREVREALKAMAAADGLPDDA